MGQTLSEPVTEKHTTSGSSKRLLWGSSGMQGWRISMEDAHTTITDYNGTLNSFFAVFDGHGGSEVAKYSGEHLYKRILDSDAFKQGKLRTALKEGFLGIDEDLRADPQYENVNSGCTAVAALITKENDLYVANAGDSRAVLSVDGRGIALSQDHKPTNEKETKRIEAAGGHVEFNRVNGNLALSRALGDFEFKSRPDLPAEEQVVTADPDITCHRITKKDEFLIVACDGIWDCMTNQEAVSFVRAELAKRTPLGEICEKMMDHCLASETEVSGFGCDNMTVIIVALLQDNTQDQWYDAMAANAADGANDNGKAASQADATDASHRKSDTKELPAAPPSP